jgi:glycosyltransferase involved in cell wall biosynthesis
MFTEGLNIVIMPVSIFEGMAGTKRVRNLADYLGLEENITISNLIIEKRKSTGKSEISVRDNIKYCKTYYNPINIIQFFVCLFRGLEFLIHQRKKCKNLIYYYDIPFTFSSLLICFFSKFLGYKIIFDIVENYGTYNERLPLISRIRIEITSFISEHLTWFASAAIGISQPIYENLTNLYKNKLIIEHIPVNFNPAKFPNNPSPDLDQTNHIKVFYGGSFGMKDGMELLLVAFDSVANEIQNVELILTGKGNKNDMHRFLLNYDKCINKNRIIYHGLVTDDEYYRLLNECDIFCMTRNGSLYANTGFPFKLAEFLATGKPVIVTKVGDVSKYLTKEDCMLIKPDSAEEISLALMTLIKSKEIRNRIGEKGKIKAYKYFDTSILEKKLLKILYQL